MSNKKKNIGHVLTSLIADPVHCTLLAAPAANGSSTNPDSPLYKAAQRFFYVPPIWTRRDLWRAQIKTFIARFKNKIKKAILVQNDACSFFYHENKEWISAVPNESGNTRTYVKYSKYNIL